MTREEAIKIKGEILNKQGSIHVGNSLIINEVVRIEDVLEIINSHVEKVVSK